MTAHSMAWDEERPAPRGTLESRQQVQARNCDSPLLQGPDDTGRIC